MTKLDVLNEIASAITGTTVAAPDIKSAIDIIAAKGKGSAVSSETIAEALSVCDTYIENIIGSDVVVEANKTASITANGTVEITPTSGSDAMAKVTATVNVPDPTGKLRVDFFQVLEKDTKYDTDVSIEKIMTKSQMAGKKIFIPGQAIEFDDMTLNESYSKVAVLDMTQGVTVEYSLTGVAAAPTATLNMTFKFSSIVDGYTPAADTLIYELSGITA